MPSSAACLLTSAEANCTSEPPNAPERSPMSSCVRPTTGVPSIFVPSAYVPSGCSTPYAPWNALVFTSTPRMFFTLRSTRPTRRARSASSMPSSFTQSITACWSRELWPMSIWASRSATG